MLAKPKFKDPSTDGFTQTLQTRVDSYFIDNKLSTKANGAMVFKSIFYVGMFVVVYFVIALAELPALAALACAAVMGFLTAGIGFNVGHDAIHGAYSKTPWINQLVGHSFSLIGANVYVWKTLHNTIHHTWTNIPNADGDLHTVGALNFFPRLDVKRYLRFQHLYAFALYSLTSLVWVFRKDFQHILKKQHYVFKKPTVPSSEIIKLAVFKTYYWVAFLAVPLWVLHYPWWGVLSGFLLMHLIAGFCLAIVFQLGHCVEGTVFPLPDENGNMQDSWLVHQLRTSANFAPGSATAKFLTGGLNLQIEHHLFPRICHVHYPQLSLIVKKTAAEYGIPYTEYPTYSSAVVSHIRHLQKVGVSVGA